MLLGLHEICYMNAVDTNILIYVNDSRDPGKQAIAASLVAIAVRHSSFATANHRAKFMDNAIALHRYSSHQLL